MASRQQLSVEHSRYGVRETTETTRTIIPELRLVGHVNYHTARPSLFFKHQHPDVLEIFYIVRGKVSWWVEGVSSAVEGNELFLVWPRELHGARDNIVEPSEYYWIQVHLPFFRKSLRQARTDPIGKLLRPLRQRKYAGAAELLPLYQSLLDEHAHNRIYRETVVRETLHLLLSLVLRCSQSSAHPLAEQVHHFDPVSRALRWARENLAEATTQEMVRVSELDSATFHKSFQALAGSRPMQYLIRLRLQNAKEQLAAGRTITETSHRLGFSSSQYFATVFRKYEGLSPSDFLHKIQKH